VKHHIKDDLIVQKEGLLDDGICLGAFGMIRTLIVDDHELVRSGVRLMLESASDIEVVGEAQSGEDALALAKTLRPDVILMDISMPGIGGFGACLRLLARHLNEPAKVLILSGSIEPLLLAKLLELGVSGYLSKHVAGPELANAIRTVYTGNQYLDPSLAETISEVFSNSALSADQSPVRLLSQKELQIFLMLSKGMAPRYIAEKLCLSDKTVGGYHHDILHKLGVKTDVELAHLAVKYHLIDIDD
jgi:two-component system invasion response regulator UvrY